MYAKVENNEIVKHPYGLQDLRLDNRNTSFPKDIFSRKDDLDEYNVVEVSETPPVYKPGWKNVEETPAWDGGHWVQKWRHEVKGVKELSRDEIVAVDAPVQDGYISEEIDPVLVGDEWHQTWNMIENDWLMNRNLAYGPASEQIEFITENGLEAWQAKVAEIKAKYPKE